MAGLGTPISTLVSNATKAVSSGIARKVQIHETGSKLKSFVQKKKSAYEQSRKPVEPSFEVHSVYFTPVRAASEPLDEVAQIVSAASEPINELQRSPAAHNEARTSGTSTPSTIIITGDEREKPESIKLEQLEAFDFENFDNWTLLSQDDWGHPDEAMLAALDKQPVDSMIRPSTIPKFAKWVPPSEAVVQMFKSRLSDADLAALEAREGGEDMRKRADSAVSIGHPSIFELVLEEMPWRYAETWASLI